MGKLNTYKLSDFSKGDPEPSKIITERFIERTQPHND